MMIELTLDILATLIALLVFGGVITAGVNDLEQIIKAQESPRAAIRSVLVILGFVVALGIVLVAIWYRAGGA